MGRDHLDQPSPELGTFFHVCQLKLENPDFHCPLAPINVLHHWEKKPTLRISDESPWSCLVFKYLIYSADGIS